MIVYINKMVKFGFVLQLVVKNWNWSLLETLNQFSLLYWTKSF